jgi:hypothetical protein
LDEHDNSIEKPSIEWFILRCRSRALDRADSHRGGLGHTLARNIPPERCRPKQWRSLQ